MSQTQANEHEQDDNREECKGDEQPHSEGLIRENDASKRCTAPEGESVCKHKESIAHMTCARVDGTLRSAERKGKAISKRNPLCGSIPTDHSKVGER